VRKHAVKIDQQAHMDELERKGPDKKATERFQRPAYQAARLIQIQGRQMEHKSVAEYMAEKLGVGDGGENDKSSEISDIDILDS
jgi:hypothetical protein